MFTSFRLAAFVAAAALVLTPTEGWSVLVAGGGGAASDCIVVFDVEGANSPAPPKTPKNVDCTDGDPTCDADGERNGECVFDIRICANSSAFTQCVPDEVETVFVSNSIDDGNPKFDPDMQALQQRADLLDLPTMDTDSCTLLSSITVRMKGPKSNQKMQRTKKKLKVFSTGFVDGRAKKDKDKMKFTCRPEGDQIYLPTELFDGTFDRIRQQIFAPSCALSGCHDSETVAGGLNLLPNSAFGNIVAVAPANGVAGGDGLLRIDGSGDTTNSFLYRKITGDLLAGYGERMPLTGRNISSQLEEILRLWIIGDMTLGPAPQTGWVDGTDQ